MAGKQRNKTADKEDHSRAMVPDGTRVYAIGDIHGRLDLMDTLIGHIDDDRHEDPVKRNVLVFLGDYIDRGPASKQVLDRLAGPMPDGFETIFLKGNHEDLMLRFLAARKNDDIDVEGQNWLMNGGDEALESYGIDIPDSLFGLAAADDIRRAQKEIRATIPKEHLSFLKKLRLNHIEGDFAFVHAGFKPATPLDKQDEGDMMWIRDEFLTDTRLFDGHVAVHGHSIRQNPEIKHNRIGIDTGAWHSHCLTALALEGDEYWFLQT